MRFKINNPAQGIESFHKRLFAIAAVMLCFCFGLMLRLYYLQLSHHHHFVTMSASNRLRIEVIKPIRGLIYDRHHQVLADNIPNYTLTLATNKTPHLQNTLMKLGKILHATPKTMAYWQHNIKQHHSLLPLILKTHLTQTERARIYVNAFQLPGVAISQAQQRHYPYNQITATPLGMIQHHIKSKHLYPLSKKTHLQPPSDGLSGIERYFDAELTGQYGHREIEVDANGQWLRTVNSAPATGGQALILTLDMQLQKKLVKAFGHETGAAVVLDPNNGEILAISSFPSYQPNAFTSNQISKYLAKWQANPEQPLFNRALFGLFPPASTIKPILALMGLHQKVITPSYRIHDRGSFQLPGTQHRYRDWLASGHHWVNLRKAIAVSCDTYFYQLAVKLGIHNIDKILANFGLGQTIATDMSSHPGVLNSPSWKHKHQHQPWYTGDTIISGIGQGNIVSHTIAISPYDCLIGQARHGFKPHLVKATVDQDQTIHTIAATPWEVMPIKKAYYETIIDAMQAVIHSQYRYHTGRRFGNSSFTVAGKTGTAELYHRNQHQHTHKIIPRKLRDHAWFIGFAPVAHPRIAIAVLVEHSPQATVIARKIFNAFFSIHPRKFSDEKHS